MQLHGFRHAHRHDPSDLAPTLPEAWKTLRGLAERAAEPGGDKRHVAGLKAAFEELKGRTPPSHLTVERELYRGQLVLNESMAADYVGWKAARCLMALWLERGGMSFVLDVLSREPIFSGGSLLWDPRPPVNSDEEWIPPGPYVSTPKVQMLWWALRARISVMEDKPFEAVREVVAEALRVRPEGPPHGGHWFRRAALLFCMSRDTELTGASIEQFRAWRKDIASADAPTAGRTFLYPAAPDAPTALALYEEHRGELWLDHLAFDVVEAHGVEARPLLEDVGARGNRESTAQERSALKMLSSA